MILVFVFIDLDTDDTTEEAATKSGTVSSDKLKRELKFAEDIKYFEECQWKCLNLTTCAGIDIEFNDAGYDCSVIDVRNIDSLTINSVSNTTRIQLVHPLRNSTIYGFATQMIAK